MMTEVNRETVRGHIAIVDDDEMFRESVARNLTDAGFAARTFADGSSALDHLGSADDAQIVLLDWKMPGLTGIDVLQRLRARQIDVPVIFLTVLSDQVYEEAGLLGGAVDFIEKSRSFSILLRRIELILDGYKAPDANTVRSSGLSRHGQLNLDHDSHRAQWNGEALGLTLTEFKIVALLASSGGRDVSYREIYDIVHGEGFVAGDGAIGYRTNVRAFIKRIRQKFRDADPGFDCVQNYPGFGYRWHDGAE
jgi:two-component system response regulator ChvI